MLDANMPINFKYASWVMFKEPRMTRCHIELMFLALACSKVSSTLPYPSLNLHKRLIIETIIPP